MDGGGADVRGQCGADRGARAAGNNRTRRPPPAPRWRAGHQSTPGRAAAPQRAPRNGRRPGLTSIGPVARDQVRVYSVRTGTRCNDAMLLAVITSQRRTQTGREAIQMNENNHIVGRQAAEQEPASHLAATGHISGRKLQCTSSSHFHPSSDLANCKPVRPTGINESFKSGQ